MNGAFALKRPRQIPCGEEARFSFFFGLINKEFKDRWGINGPLHRLCSIVRKMGVRSFVSEELELNEEICEERWDLQDYLRFAGHDGARVSTRARRISFFRSSSKNWRQMWCLWM